VASTIGFAIQDNSNSLDTLDVQFENNRRKVKVTKGEQRLSCDFCRDICSGSSLLVQITQVAHCMDHHL